MAKPRFGPAIDMFRGECAPQDFLGMVELPNCDDPVFRAWCSACDLVPGKLYASQDARIAELERYMQGHDPTYDPESDPYNDY